MLGAHPLVNRTRNGMTRLGLVSFWPKRVMPLRAGYRERERLVSGFAFRVLKGSSGPLCTSVHKGPYPPIAMSNFIPGTDADIPSAVTFRHIGAHSGAGGPAQML